MSELNDFRLYYEVLDSEYKQIKVLRILTQMRRAGFRRKKGDYERICRTLYGTNKINPSGLL